MTLYLVTCANGEFHDNERPGAGPDVSTNPDGAAVTASVADATGSCGPHSVAAFFSEDVERPWLDVAARIFPNYADVNCPPWAAVLSAFEKNRAELEAAQRRAGELEVERDAAIERSRALEEAKVGNRAAESGARNRRRLPDDRQAVTRRLLVHGTDGTVKVYVTVGLYEDGTPGELFLKVDRQGTTLSGFADALAVVVSLALQHGVPLASITTKLRHTRFEPAGRTGDDVQPVASSLLDVVAGWLERRFPATEASKQLVLPLAEGD